MMFYFHSTICISPQAGFPGSHREFSLQEAVDNRLSVIEPAYAGIPAALKRRMGKSVRMAVGAALPLLQNQPAPDGIILATANGGMEDCIKFLNQILEYREGLLTPASFVQSTSNAAAAQIALTTKNYGYNITHVHRGLAFENALMDAYMWIEENPDREYLLGATDEISPYNHNIDRLAGWFSNTALSNRKLFGKKTSGTIAGEGALMTRVSNRSEGALGKLRAMRTIHSTDLNQVMESIRSFLQAQGRTYFPDLLITGEDGDDRLDPFYTAAEQLFPETTGIARFKHLCGEYCTAGAYASWLALEILQQQQIPDILVKRPAGSRQVRDILIYNTYRGLQHSLLFISVVY